MESRADDRDRYTSLVKRHRRWLGNVTIPFASLLASGGRIRCEMRLETPPVNLGYRQPSVLNVGPSNALGPGGATRAIGGGSDPAATSSENAGGAGGVFGGGMMGVTGGNVAPQNVPSAQGVGLVAGAEANRRATHVWLQVSIDPHLPAAEGGEDLHHVAGGLRLFSGLTAGANVRALRGHRLSDLPLEERQQLEDAADWSDSHARWSQSRFTTSSTLEHRIVRAVVSNCRGGAVLVTRYLSALQPPPDAASAVALHQQTAAAISAASTGVEDTSAPYSGDPSAVMPACADTVPRVSSPDAAARFVALLPYLRGLSSGSSEGGMRPANTLPIWPTCQETLDMGAGDCDSHALLLANYFQWFDMQGGGGSASGFFGAGGMSATGVDSTNSRWRTFIVLGRAQPEGEAAWVLRQDINAVPPVSLLISPLTGRAYMSSDDGAPLSHVGMVADGTNAWANIQEHDAPWRMSFDVGNATEWAPLFGPGGLRPPALPAPLQTPLQYRLPDTRLAAALEREISGALIASIRAWRPRYITRVRMDVSAALRPMLLELEARAAGSSGATVLPASEGLMQVVPGLGVGAVTVAPNGTITMPSAAALATRPGARMLTPGAARDLAGEHAATLTRLASRYTAYGFPLHCTFTDLEAVIAAVKATGVHRIEDEAAPFAVACVVVPYANDVFSVWVYVIALLPQTVA